MACLSLKCFGTCSSSKSSAVLRGDVQQHMVLSNCHLTKSVRSGESEKIVKSVIDGLISFIRYLIMFCLLVEDSGLYRSDVYDLPPGTYKTVKMHTRDVGTWLFHCHVSSHLDAGMESTYTVMK